MQRLYLFFLVEVNYSLIIGIDMNRYVETCIKKQTYKISFHRPRYVIEYTLHTYIVDGYDVNCAIRVEVASQYRNTLRMIISIGGWYRLFILVNLIRSFKIMQQGIELRVTIGSRTFHRRNVWWVRSSIRSMRDLLTKWGTMWTKKNIGSNCKRKSKWRGKHWVRCITY